MRVGPFPLVRTRSAVAGRGYLATQRRIHQPGRSGRLKPQSDRYLPLSTRVSGPPAQGRGIRVPGWSPGPAWSPAAHALFGADRRESRSRWSAKFHWDEAGHHSRGAWPPPHPVPLRFDLFARAQSTQESPRLAIKIDSFSGRSRRLIAVNLLIINKLSTLQPSCPQLVHNLF